jgi:hypothetical protein
LLAPLIALWRNVAALAMMVAERATDGLPRGPFLRPLIETALRTVASVVIAVWLLALLPSGWSLIGVAGGVLLLLAVVTVVFWPRLVRVHSRLEIELREQLRQASQSAGSSAWSGVLLRQPTDWRLDIDEVTLPTDSAHAGRTWPSWNCDRGTAVPWWGLIGRGMASRTQAPTRRCTRLTGCCYWDRPRTWRAASSLGATQVDGGRASDFGTDDGGGGRSRRLATGRGSRWPNWI